MQSQTAATATLTEHNMNGLCPTRAALVLLLAVSHTHSLLITPIIPAPTARYAHLGPPLPAYPHW